MKKLFLLLITVACFSTSCSSDENTSVPVVNDPVSFFKVKVNGTLTEFPTIVITPTNGGSSQNWNYSARRNGTEQFNWHSNEGSDVFGTFGYFANNQGYTIYPEVIVTENSATKLTGTWSGTGYDMNGQEAFEFTDGTFEIYHD